MSAFHFKKFYLEHDKSTMKIGTDAVLLASLVSVDGAQTLLDIGCGCGVVTFCVAQKMVQHETLQAAYGIDPDEESVREAQRNAANYPLASSDRFHFVQMPLQTFSQWKQVGKFDLIVSNPPFYGNDLKPEKVSRLKSKHRDEQLSFSELIEGVKALLQPQGRFVLILPKIEGEEFHTLAAQSGLYCQKRTFIQPTLKKPVHRVVLQYALTPVSTCEEQLLVIRGADNAYTEAYRQQTKAFLL